jgi:cell division protein FtsX
MILLFKLSLRPWRLSLLSQLCSALAVGFLLTMAGFLFWVQQGLRPVLSRLHQEQVITAYLSPAVESGAEQKVADAIQLSLGAQAARSEIRLVGARQFVAEVAKQYPELAKDIEDLGSDATPLVPRYVSIAGVLEDATLDRVRSVSGIESAESSKDRYRNVLGAFAALRWIARLLVAGLALALFTGLIHLARTNAYIHREAAALMRLWGGSGAVLQAPGILSGLSVGMLGGAFAATGWMSTGLWLGHHVKNLSPLLREMPAPNPAFAGILLVAGALIGLAAGGIAGTVSGSSGLSAGEQGRGAF